MGIIGALQLFVILFLIVLVGYLMLDFFRQQ